MPIKLTNAILVAVTGVVVGTAASLQAQNVGHGSPGLVLGTHFVDNGGGVSTANPTNLGIDSRTDGGLLVTHGKNGTRYYRFKLTP